MYLPAGGGTRILFRAWLFWPGLALAAETSSEEPSWLVAANLALPPHSAWVAMVRQTGPDLVVKSVRNAAGSEEQDGPDARFGTEILLLENPSDTPAAVELSVRNVYPGLEPSFEIDLLRNPTSEERAAAELLARAARILHNDKDATGALALTEAALASARGTQLYVVALVQHVQALLQGTRYQDILNVIAAADHARASELDTRIYLQWMEAVSHWQLRNLDAALQRFSALDALLQDNPETSTPGRFLDRQHIKANHGAVIVTDGLRRGDDARMREGAALIDNALSNAAGYDDFRLLGELHNYVSGYSTMLYNRIDDGGRKALDLAEYYYQKAQDLRALADIKNNKAFTLLGSGKIGEAQALYREAILITEQTGDRYAYAFYLGRLAATYAALGDYARAETLFGESITLMHELGFEKIAINNEIELGAVYQAQQRHAEALSVFLALLQETADDSWAEEALRIHTAIALSYLETGQLDAVKRHIAAASNLIAAVNRLDYRLGYVLVAADLALEEEEYGAATAMIQNALAEIRDDFQEPDLQLELYRRLARSYFLDGQHTQALAAGRRASELIENTRRQIDILTLGAAWSARTDAIFDQNIAQLLSLHDSSQDPAYAEEAFGLVQSGKALNLRQARAQSAAAAPPESSTAASETLARLWQEMNESSRAVLAASLQDAPIAALESELVARQEAYRMAGASTTPADLDFAGRAMTIKEVQLQLDDTSVVSSYHIGQDASVRFDISRDGWSVQRLPGQAELQAQIDAYLESMKPNDRRSFELSSELAAVLLPPADTLAGISRLIIEPDSLLARVPFAALSLQSPGYTPLAASLSLVHSSSLSGLFDAAEPAQAGADAALSLAIFADPVFAALDTLPGSDSQLAGYSDWRGTLGPLPFTRVEAEAVRRLFPEDEVRMFLGEAATVSNFVTEESRSASILHVATHGFAEPGNVNLTGLAFAQEASNASGLLTIAELNKYAYRNQLIVISGCETGEGPLLEGEGIMSLARAFIAQGAGAVIATLWPISDRATAAFMQAFYSALLETKNVPQALQRAQMNMLASPEYRHPYYWGGFVLNAAEATALSFDER